MRTEDEVESRVAELRKMVNWISGREARVAVLREVKQKLHAPLEVGVLEPLTDDPLAL